MVIVGGQVARDEAGNVVGKGDMRAQIEQVGRNVDTCLAAGGATANDIVFTVNRVTEPAEFDKHTDLLRQYFGLPSPKSMTVPAGQLPNPDFLLQVEAFAMIK
jgi:2-iminobutanoate/2-iminopropanoate deaminase